MSNDIKTWAAGCLIMLLIFTGTDHGHAGQQTDSKEPPRYLASFFPSTSPFGHSGIKNRLNRKKAARKAETANKKNYQHFRQKATPVLALIHASATHQDLARQVLVFWQLGDLIYEEKSAHKGNPQYHDLLRSSLARDSGLSIQTIGAIERMYSKYRVAADLSLQLGWGHYIILISIDDKVERTFYQTRAVEKHWTPQELGQAVKNQRYKRGAKSP
jgi:hypothetical protein